MIRNRYPCRYAIVRFTPHVETGEFANIGIVLICAAQRYFGFRLSPSRKHARVTNFFEPLDPQVYRGAVSRFLEELRRIEHATKRRDPRQVAFDFERAADVDHVFSELTRIREGLVTFSEVRSIMVLDPEEAIDHLFDFYVNKSFVSQSYREAVLEKDLRASLEMRNLSKRFEKKTFDDGLYKATFPFVELVGEHAQKVIKPLYLGQKDATAIIDHGNKWKTSVERLRRANMLRGRVLFAVEGPTGDDRRSRAFREMVAVLKDASVDVLPFDDQARILEYAASGSRSSGR
jgi:hypothetical protein